MPLARFHSAIGSPVINETEGTISGCRIATLNAVSIAAKENGAGLVMDARMIKGLLDKAKSNGDRVPAFFSHDWDASNKDPIHSDAGVWNNFALDNEGNLIATFTAFETPFKAGIFSRAKVDPQGITVSPVFHYKQRNGDARFCDPTDFISSDFVKEGAINKALFEADQQTKPMDISELITMLSDPAVKDALKAIIKSVEANEVDPNEADATTSETEAGVMAEDKKPEDDTKPALMRAAIRINRATSRKLKSLGDERAAILAEAKTAGAAEATAMLGKNKFIGHGEGGDQPETATAKFSAAVKELTDKGVKTGAATLAVMKSHEPVYADMQKERGIFKS